ncbi:MAG: 2,3-bisphosphoglycerate-dependent phosphoglycerate mutase [Solirubrobacteraceae bacterium]|nr:2,3-bisphosphoglycerate-dependent phosphoglycerate mutase [Solirubrobacteraceae bacterium]
MCSSNEVLLVRHGETDDNAADRFQGRIDTPLNDRGREQSRALAAALAAAGLRAMYASPLSRARETAAIVGERIGLDAVLDERFMEADAGAWSGLLYAEVIATDAPAFDAWRRDDDLFRFPGGESLVEHRVRVAAALARVRSGPLPALVVCHGGTIRAVGGLAGPRGEVGNCVLHRLSPSPAATTIP